MFLRPDGSDLRVIAFNLSRIVSLVGLAMLLPAIVAVLRADWNSASALGIGAALAMLAGFVGRKRLSTRERIDWSHGLVTAAAAWLVVPIFGAVPLYLSGAYASGLDAGFEALSGLTTTGMTMLQDGDHLASSLQLWRHMLQFIGGQGFVVLALTVLTVGSGQSGTMTVGEARADRILPNTIGIARFVVQVAVAYAAVLITALTLANLLAGLPPGRAMFHALLVFLSAYDTSGFAATSASLGYYHSPLVEAVTVVGMLAGALAYGLHYAVWRGKAREVRRNLQSRLMAASLLTLGTVTLVGLGRSGAFTDAVPLLRKGVFTVISAHTTTGLTVADPRLILSDWGLLAPAAFVGAMAAGGMAGSSAGGIKALRLGLVAKGIIKDVRAVLLPESALVVVTYHAGRRQILRDLPVTAAVSLLLITLLSITAGGIVGLFFGADFTSALFESASAATNSGMSVGVLGPSAATTVKVIAMLQMWFGRLEYLAVFTMIGYLFATVRGRA